MSISDIKLAFRASIHPFKVFWELKHENKGKLSVAFSCLGLWIIINIFGKMFTGYLFNTNFGVQVDFLSEIRNVFLMFFLCCIANWSVTTLMDGKGRLRDIIITFCYSAIPMIMIRLFAIILSNVISYSEFDYYNILMFVSWFWFFALLFFGMLVIHDYTVIKTIATFIITIVSMCIIIFISMILISMVNQLYTFLITAYKELIYRI